MEKLRVLFVCVGNAFRSQAAQAFARALGSDFLEVESAGVAPAADLPAVTIELMAVHGIDVTGQYPKGLDEVDPDGFDLIINMSGHRLPVDPRVPIREWDIPDPVGRDRAVHEEVFRRIEERVRALVDELRQGRS